MPRHPPCTLSSLTTFIDHRHKIKEARSQKREAGRKTSLRRHTASEPPTPPIRPQGSGKRYERPIMGQINTRRASNCSSHPPHNRYCPLRRRSDSRPSIRQKGARRSSGQDRKDQGARGGFKSANTKIQAGRSQSIETCPPGDTDDRPLKTFC
jgi:hypothetical protein